MHNTKASNSCLHYRSCQIKPPEYHQVEGWKWKNTDILPHRENCQQVAHHWSMPLSDLFRATKTCRWIWAKLKRVLPSSFKSLVNKSSSSLPCYMARTDWPPGRQRARWGGNWTRNSFKQRSNRSVSDSLTTPAICQKFVQKKIEKCLICRLSK